jgi:hypothetical protein
VGGPYGTYQGYERFKVALRGRKPLVDLHTDWDDAAEYAFFACWRGWTHEQVDAIPLWLRRRYRAAAAEWEKYLRGE